MAQNEALSCEVAAVSDVDCGRVQLTVAYMSQLVPRSVLRFVFVFVAITNFNPSSLSS